MSARGHEADLPTRPAICPPSGKADQTSIATGPNKIRSARVALLDFQEDQEVPGAPEVQEVQRVPGDLLGLLRRPALLDLQRQGHLYRPLLPRDLEALEALQVPETNRNHSTQASSPKPRPTTFSA
jgi:hypothetical protein